MSAEQSEQIERAVYTLSKDNPLFEDALERNRATSEPLFIKNLENVQGDERDVIFVSCTYGPQEIGGPVLQRFGPINWDDGWRRLNVLFTRAKKRLHVFSSMGSGDIILSGSSKRGVKVFKDYLDFAEKGHIDQPTETGRRPDSDFEKAVASALQDAGFECVFQVGTAGYYIDIAVKDPGKPGQYLMDIECDGKTYHSAKSVRDRDRLRQAVLERLGWRIRRIWSVDWFKNPEAVLRPIIQELNEIKTEMPPEPSRLEEVEEESRRYEQEKQVAESFVSEVGNLRDKLLRFDLEVIRKALPDTPEDKRLLRPAMLEALLESTPMTKWEFQHSIPLYLREAIAPEEGDFLESVLQIIQDSVFEQTVH